MGQIAFVFSGQGAQVPGMGAALAAKSAAAKKVYDMAELIRPGTFAQIQNADKAELSLTINTQPCLFCVDLAAAEALRARGIIPDRAAGFSLGEIPALAFTGVLPFETAFKLVITRAKEMQRCAEETQGGMAAVLGLSDVQVEAACQSVPGVYAVNYNCPGQVVVAGPKDALASATGAIKALGGRVMPLNVSGAFHTPYMQRAADALKAQLTAENISMPHISLYSNVTGERYQPPYEDLIARQAASPVRFAKTIENMAVAGVDTFIEVGVGKTLCGLIQKTVKGVRTFAVTDPESLEETVLQVNGEKHA